MKCILAISSTYLQFKYMLFSLIVKSQKSVEIHAVQPNNHFTESCMAATSNVDTTMSNCTLTNNTLTDSIRYKDASLVRRNNHTYHANEGSMSKGKMFRKK